MTAQPARPRHLVFAALALLAVWHLLDQRRDGLVSLRQRQAYLEQRLERRLAADPRAHWPEGDVLLGVPAPFASRFLGRVVSGYLRRVYIHLERVRVRKSGEIKGKLLFATVTVGRWSMDLLLEHVRGTLRLGTPELRFQGDRVRVWLPLAVEGGEARGRVRFAWDSKGVANVVCKDFEGEQKVEAHLPPQTHHLTGKLWLRAGERSITAEPEPGDFKITLRVEPSRETWRALHSLLKEQSGHWRCGLAMKPDKIVRRLQELLDRGVPVRLPPRLLQNMRLPAAVRESVTLWGREAELDVQPLRLTVGGDTLWYAARVSVLPSPSAPR